MNFLFCWFPICFCQNDIWVWQSQCNNLYWTSWKNLAQWWAFRKDYSTNSIKLRPHTVYHVSICTNDSPQKQPIDPQTLSSHSSVPGTVPALPGSAGSPEHWMHWAVRRMQVEPWALGGAIVIAVFVGGFLSLVAFALIFGCCCSSSGKGKREMKNSVL